MPRSDRPVGRDLLDVAVGALGGAERRAAPDGGGRRGGDGQGRAPAGAGGHRHRQVAGLPGPRPAARVGRARRRLHRDARAAAPDRHRDLPLVVEGRRAAARPPADSRCSRAGQLPVPHKVARRDTRTTTEDGTLFDPARPTTAAGPRRSCGCGSGPTRPRPATVTSSSPASPTAPGGRCRCQRWSASGGQVPDRRRVLRRAGGGGAAEADVVVTNHALLAIAASGLHRAARARRDRRRRGARAGRPGDRRRRPPSCRAAMVERAARSRAGCVDGHRRPRRGRPRRCATVLVGARPRAGSDGLPGGSGRAVRAGRATPRGAQRLAGDRAGRPREAEVAGPCAARGGRSDAAVPEHDRATSSCGRPHDVTVGRRATRRRRRRARGRAAVRRRPAAALGAARRADSVVLDPRDPGRSAGRFEPVGAARLGLPGRGRAGVGRARRRQPVRLPAAGDPLRRAAPAAARPRRPAPTAARRARGAGHRSRRPDAGAVLVAARGERGRGRHARAARRPDPRAGRRPAADSGRAFIADEATCLFGTLSLWQGVDVPGPTCRLVVIDRIPFPRPDDPLELRAVRSAIDEGGRERLHGRRPHARGLLLAQGAAG